MFQHKFRLTTASAFSSWWNWKWHLSISLWSLGGLTGCTLSEICRGFFTRVWRYFYRQVVFHVAWHNNLRGCAAWAKMDTFQLPYVTALCQRIIIMTMFSAHSWDIVPCPINKENGFQQQCSCQLSQSSNAFQGLSYNLVVQSDMQSSTWVGLLSVAKSVQLTACLKTAINNKIRATRGHTWGGMPFKINTHRGDVKCLTTWREASLPAVIAITLGS